MKAIVTGATGFLGGHLVDKLLADGWEVIALGRNISKGQILQQAGAHFKAVDLTDGDKLQKAFEPADVVFHCAALSSAWGEYSDFYRMNVEATRHVLNSAQKHKIAKLVHVSSTSVYFNFSDHCNIRESEVLSSHFANAYAKTKYLSEQILLNERNGNTEVVIIRPRGIIGEGDTSIMPRIMRIAKRGWFPLLKQGRALVDITYVKNAVNALLLAARAENVNGECINISNQQALSVAELLHKIFSQQKFTVRLVPVSYRALDGMALVMEFFHRLFRLSEPVITRYGLGLLRYSQTLNADKARDLLGYEPEYDLDEAIQRYMKWKNESGI
ncbi:UDP-glucose 4-epimerase [hydrothermal vent metagenome]|uniref:UDP-glucose 4-epimerase n=1 Tax=hydrothermal vent metagenome TaxID=652676 RepID=A0A3B0YKH8_9ZZZZ